VATRAVSIKNYNTRFMSGRLEFLMDKAFGGSKQTMARCLRTSDGTLSDIMKGKGTNKQIQQLLNGCRHIGKINAQWVENGIGGPFVRQRVGDKVIDGSEESDVIDLTDFDPDLKHEAGNLGRDRLKRFQAVLNMIFRKDMDEMSRATGIDTYRILAIVDEELVPTDEEFAAIVTAPGSLVREEWLFRGEGTMTEEAKTVPSELPPVEENHQESPQNGHTDHVEDPQDREIVETLLAVRQNMVDTLAAVERLEQTQKKELDVLRKMVEDHQEHINREKNRIWEAMRVQQTQINHTRTLAEKDHDRIEILSQKIDGWIDQMREELEKAQKTPADVVIKTSVEEKDYPEDAWMTITQWLSIPVNPYTQYLVSDGDRRLAGNRIAKVYMQQAKHTFNGSDEKANRYRVADMRIYGEWLVNTSRAFYSGEGPKPDMDAWTRHWVAVSGPGPVQRSKGYVQTFGG
jgi:predicted kinase